MHAKFSAAVLSTTLRYMYMYFEVVPFYNKKQISTGTAKCQKYITLAVYNTFEVLKFST